MIKKTPVAGTTSGGIDTRTETGQGLKQVGDILYGFLTREALAGDPAARRLLQAYPQAGIAEENGEGCRSHGGDKGHSFH